MGLIDPIDLIRRAHKAGAISDKELIALQEPYAPRCSLHADRPAKIRDGRLCLCEACATARMPQILQRERERLERGKEVDSAHCTTTPNNLQTEGTR